MHRVVEPAILYFGTPVVLISTKNEDGTFNLAPISSAFWLGWRCVIGIGTNTKTSINMLRTRECVLNLPSVNEVGAVNKLARLTGCNPVPARKLGKGYRYEPNKFHAAGLTPVVSEVVDALCVKECPVQLEAVIRSINPIGEDDEKLKSRIVSYELKIVKIRVDDRILIDDDLNRIDPDKWRPLIMSFQHFYGLGNRIHESILAEIPESLYKMVKDGDQKSG
jgi:flavin reductase (DIM6/NTAB) family NADH-FMN oxidoreductase RutF